MVTRECHL